MERPIEQKVSRNFQAAKFFSILIVTLGHFPKPFDIWVIVTIGLLVFSYSSGFFTYLKYHGDFDKKKFLYSKIERLGINLAVVNFFILIILLIQGKDGIWTWHSIINVLGLNGFLTWLRIPNQSPFGAAMWFFTLLLIFYLIYPVLEYLNRNKTVSYIFTILFILTMFYLHHHIKYGHMLWLTCCGFITGICCARNNIKLSLYSNIAMFILCLILTFCFNYFLKISYYNFFFIFFFAMSLIFSLNYITIPDFIIKGSSFFGDSILEIYLIHSYITIMPTKYLIVNFAISLACVLFASLILQKISSQIIQTIKSS